MKADEIKDDESLMAWLSARPKEDAIAIAIRSALRVFPLWLAELDAHWARSAELSELPPLRLFLASGVARRSPAPDTRDAAIAASAADFAARSGAMTTSQASSRAANSAAAAAFRVMETVTGANASAAAVAASLVTKSSAIAVGKAGETAYDTYNASDQTSFWLQISLDAQILSLGDDPFTAPLWSSTPPDWFTQADGRWGYSWPKKPDKWNFWTRWWDGVLSGQQLDWELQKAVALIPDAIWQSGPAAVSEAIREIELDFAISQTPNAEILAPDPATGLFDVRPDTRLPADHLRDVVLKIGDAGDTFGGLEETDNRYTAAKDDIAYLRRRAARDGNDPRALHDLCRSVSRRIAARVADQSLPPDDPLVQDCIRQLDDAALDIVGFDEKTREVVTHRATLRLENIDRAAMPDLIEVANQIAALTQGVLVEDIPEDARLILDTNTPADIRADAAYRELSRLSRIMGWYRGLGSKEKVLAKGGALIAAAGGVNILFDLFRNLWAVLQWLWLLL